MRRVLLVTAMLLVLAAPAFAQIDTCPRYAELIDNVVKGASPGAAVDLVDVGQSPRCFALFAAGLDRADRSAFREFVRRLEAARADKQAGTAAGAGSTSVVAQGPVAKVLSVAAEYGAVTQTVNGQVVTIRGNLAGVPSALVRKDVFPYCVGPQASTGFCVDGSALSVLKRFSFSVSFDPSRTQTLEATPAEGAAAAEEVTFTGKSREISAIGVRAELWNRRDATSPDFIKAWRAKVGAAMTAAAGDLLQAGEFAVQVASLKTYSDWRTRTIADVRAVSTDRAKVIGVMTAALTALVDDARKNVPEFEVHVNEALAAYSRFFLAQDDLIEEIAMKNVLAFEYSNNRPVGQAATSNYRFILDYPITKKTKVVANGAITFYDSVPEGQTVVKRYRDLQIGAQLDHGIEKASILGPAVLSLAGYFQYQHAPALLEVDPAEPLGGVTFVGLPEGAKEVFTKTGNIFLAQFKLSLVPPGSSVKIPLSVTYSNRTELIDKPAWRGQVGISYDLDSLFAVLNGR